MLGESNFKNLIKVKMVQSIFYTLKRKKKRIFIFYSQGNRECAQKMVNSFCYQKKMLLKRESNECKVPSTH